MTSRGREDALYGYCGSCHAFTSDPAVRAAAAAVLERMQEVQGGGLDMVPGGHDTAALTPEVLLRHPGWSLARADEQIAEFTWDPVACPSPRSWALSPELGHVQATCGLDHEPVIRVETRVFARLLADRAPESPAEYGWTLAARVHLADTLRRQDRQPRAGLRHPGLYRCPRCHDEAYVPPGRTGAVLCGRHGRDPEVMEDISVPAWSRPDADPLADLRRARQLIEEYRDQGEPPAAMRYIAERCGPPGVSSALGGALDIPFETSTDQAGTARYLALRQAGFSSDEARSWADSYMAAAAYSREAVTELEQAAGEAVVQEAMTELDRRIRQSLGLPAGWLPEASYIPDREPPRRALPGTSAPSEHGADPGTAARTAASDYDDPERVFL
jgi:hypothetical protein